MNTRICSQCPILFPTIPISPFLIHLLVIDALDITHLKCRIQHNIIASTNIMSSTNTTTAADNITATRTMEPVDQSIWIVGGVVQIHIHTYMYNRHNIIIHRKQSGQFTSSGNQVFYTKILPIPIC